MEAMSSLAAMGSSLEMDFTISAHWVMCLVP